MEKTDTQRQQREIRIRHVIDKCHRRLADGEALSDEEILREHPDLRPELDVELKKLRDVLAAMKKPPQPRHIGRYRVERVLGEGGFGRVYLAWDDQLERHVAVKVPHRRLVASRDIANDYLAEARTVAGLSDADARRIVPVYDAGSTDEFPCYIVSKYIDGESLAARLRASRPEHAETAKLVATAAEALHYAHTHGVVHRDVKPGNILMDSGGTPYVADFGLALKEADVGKGPRYAGTLAYMSPEQARGEGHRVDGRSDIYSLGTVLYELLVGRRPFAGDTQKELLKNIASQEAKPPRQIDDAIPRELERICLKALSKRASDRYTTAKDLADDLRSFLTEVKGAPARATHEAAAPAVPPDSTYASADSDTAKVGSDSQPIRIVPKGLRSFDEHDADFFLELLSGARDRHGLPDSIRFWKTRIEETDADKTFSVGLIYGPSGCGKSSLVKAGLLPRLSPHVIPVYIEATGNETESRLLWELRKHYPAISDNLGLKESLKALRRGYGIPVGEKFLIVLDQFEQWLHAKKEEGNTNFVEALRQCDGGRLQCLVMVRDDFWLAVSRFMRDLEVRLLEGQNSGLVDLFDTDHARRVLAAFGRAFGRLPESGADISKAQKEFLKQAAAGLADDNKVVCVRLAVFAEMMKGRSWTPDELKKVGGTTGIGATFLEETFSSSTAPPEHRYHQKAARAVLKTLLPDSGADIKGQMKSYDELMQASGYAGCPKDFEDLIRILDSEVRLITPTDPEGIETDDDSASHAEPGKRYFQLAHDYLVPSLRDWLTRKQKESRRGRAELWLAEQTILWRERRERRFLPNTWRYLHLLLFTRRQRWNSSERSMMQHTGTLALRRAAFSVVLVVVVMLCLREYILWSRARDLVEALVITDTFAIGDLLAQIPACERWAVPRLETYFHTTEDGSLAKRNTALALLHFDNSAADYVLLDIARIQNGASIALICDILARNRVHINDHSIEILKGHGAGDSNTDRVATTALVALRIERSEHAWPLFRPSPDPTLRTAMINRYREFQCSPGTIVDRLMSQPPANELFGLLLTLGQCDRQEVSNLQAFTSTCLMDLLGHELPEVHSAAQWAIAKWGVDSAQILPQFEDRDLDASIFARQPRGWYRNSEGQTMVAVQGPLKLMMGSPDGEADREEQYEQREEKEIPWSFAISATEVTREQFLKYRPEPDDDKLSPRSPKCPMTSVSWYEAAAYCNWLSRQGGVPEEQFCYFMNNDGRYQEVPNWQNCIGYRLPTEKEWEYCCRGMTSTSRYFGEDTKWLSRYGWHSANSKNLGKQPVGSLMPNDLGLFDMHGNVWEWCHDEFAADTPVIEPLFHIRGGGFNSPASHLRSAQRSWILGSGGESRPAIGFRIARTLKVGRDQDSAVGTLKPATVRPR